jgi:hypothetical protein
MLGMPMRVCNILHPENVLLPFGVWMVAAEEVPNREMTVKPSFGDCFVLPDWEPSKRYLCRSYLEETQC